MLILVDMDIPPIIPTDNGRSQAVPPKLTGVRPRMTQAQSPQTASEPPFISTPPPIANAAPKPNLGRRAIPKEFNRKTLAGGFCLLLILFGGLYVYGTLYAPKRCMHALASAMDRRDRQTVEKYVDAPALAESYRRDVVELYKRQEATNNASTFADRLLDPLGDNMANWVVNATITPDSVISMMCGEDPNDAMKRGIEDRSGSTVDSITSNAGPETKVYGLLGKVLIDWAVGYAIDESAQNAKINQAEMNPDDYIATTQYESLNRILIIVTHRNSDDPSLGFVLERHGLVTWKFAGVRLISSKKATASGHHF